MFNAFGQGTLGHVGGSNDTPTLAEKHAALVTNIKLEPMAPSEPPTTINDTSYAGARF